MGLPSLPSNATPTKADLERNTWSYLPLEYAVHHYYQSKGAFPCSNSFWAPFIVYA